LDDERNAFLCNQYNEIEVSNLFVQDINKNMQKFKKGFQELKVRENQT